jgi:hypothetical protein
MTGSRCSPIDQRGDQLLLTCAKELDRDVTASDRSPATA